MRKYSKLIPLLVISTFLMVPAAFSEEPKTLSVIDDRGGTVDVPASPERIASISYLATDVALALGIKPRSFQ